MKKTISVLIFMLCAALLLPLGLTACNTAQPSEPQDTTPDGTTPADTPEDTTPADTEPPKEPSVLSELDVEWHSGRITSNFNGSYPSLSQGGDDYMYTDIITVEKAGTEIMFKDDLVTISSNNDSAATRYDYVVSSWKEYGNGRYWVMDSDGINISGASAGGSPIEYPKGEPTRTSVTYKYVTSKDNEHIRLCFKSKGSDKKPTVYMTTNAGVGTYAGHLEFLEESKNELYNESLEGLTMALFGDSYLAGNALRGEYTWAQMIADKYEMKLYNHSIGGSTISDKVTSNTPLVQRWDKASGNPDIIVIEGGRNDSREDFNIKIGTNEDTTTYTFKGALIYMLKNLREKYPNAMIIGVTSYNSPDRSTTIKYAKAMRELFEYYGFPCIYAADPDISGVDTGNAIFREMYMEYPYDYSHLNYRGHKLAFPYFEKAMSQCYNDFKAGKYEEKVLPNAQLGGSVTNNPTQESNVKWTNGFVGSDTIGNGQEWMLVGNSVYAYSEVITVAKAGTVITFRDYGDRAAHGAFVISSWKQSGGTWVIDKSGTNLRGNDATIYKSENGYNVWTYVTTKDNENIRLCYRCENDPSYPFVDIKAP